MKALSFPSLLLLFLFFCISLLEIIKVFERVYIYNIIEAVLLSEMIEDNL